MRQRGRTFWFATKREFTMKRLILLMACVYGTQANANDYQLIPLPTWSNLSPRVPVITSYNLLVTDQTTGAIFSCNASMEEGSGLPPTYFLTGIECTKGTVINGGTMPSGPAVPSPPSFQTNFTSPPAIWKIDSTSGTLTFCGGNVSGVAQWLRGEKKLQ